MKKLCFVLWGGLLLACCGILGATAYFSTTVPDDFAITTGETFSLGGMIEASPTEKTVSALHTAEETPDSYGVALKLWGVFPIKEVTVTVSPQRSVMVSGVPFGIKLYTEGVLVVGTGDVETAVGTVNPATAAGIAIGDTILSIGGKAVSSNEDVAAIINASGGSPLTFHLSRDGVPFDATFTPVHPKDGTGYKAGLWVRDSTAGIGTLTFYDPATRVFAGLGHPVSDVDTGEAMSISRGEIVPAQIYSVARGSKGNPGSLEGGFDFGTLGMLTENHYTGLYGTLTRFPQGAVLMPVASKQSVRTGKAQILSTVDGNKPRLYEVNIDQVRLSGAAKHAMVISVTDEELLATTGGIVQGMSGSPIIQNGKLIGAITHVLVDDPTAGYAIFAENMLETAQSVANENKLKEAS